MGPLVVALGLSQHGDRRLSGEPEPESRRSGQQGPELRADSRYNRDNGYITSHYALSSDPFAVMVRRRRKVASAIRP